MTAPLELATPAGNPGAVVRTNKPWQPPQPAIFKVLPDEGPAGGMQVVTLTGHNLGQVTQVRFGESPGLSLQLLDEDTLQVTTPPRPAGVATVGVVSEGRPDATLPDAYRFVAAVAVTAVSPNHGAAHGGTQVTVTGSGFSAQTQFVFGERAATQVVVVDDHTATLLAPPGPVGAVPLTAASPDGQAVLKGAFTYHSAPLLAMVWPATGPLAGDVEVTLTGLALVAKKAQVRFVQGKTDLPAVIVHGTPDATALTVVAPAAWAAGAWSVRYVNADGVTELANAFQYIDAKNGGGLLGVAAAELPVNQLQPVVVALAGPLSAQNLATAKVQFGGQPAKVLQALAGPEGLGLGGSLLVQPPAFGGTVPQAVDVVVDVGAATLKKAAAFSYLQPTSKVLTVAPVAFALSGGTPVQLEIANAKSHGGVVGVRIGALTATQLKLGPPLLTTADTHATMLAPMGAPGPAEVRVLLQDGSEAVFAEQAEFIGKSTTLAAIVPGRGAMAGGTAVVGVGAGLGKVSGVTLGGTAVKSWQLLHDGAFACTTPPHAPGAATLDVTTADGQHVLLLHAFEYFDPTSVENGSWGPPIDGAVNVTVLKKGKIGPVVGATVMLGSDAATPLKGLTDANGQVTLSAKGLLGPLHVHATKKGWSAASAVALNAENITLRIQEFSAAPGPPSPNADTPAPPPGTVSATVVDAEKYTVFPMGSCEGQQPILGNCKPCTTDAQCQNGATCQILQTPLLSSALPVGVTATQDKSFCASPCTAHSDCPSDFECRAVGPSLAAIAFRCTPRIGTPQVRCEGSGYSIFGGSPKQTNDGVVGKDGKVTVAVNPGDSAVICRSGYLDKKTNEFVPLALGIARKLFATPGQNVKNVVVHVTVPLDRTIRARMERIPVGSDAHGLRQLTIGLDLGAEGYLPLGNATTYAVTDTLLLQRQPAPSLWAGENGDLRYELYGGIAQGYGSPPSSTSQATDIDPRGLNRSARLEPGATVATEADGAVAGVLALDQAGPLRVAVGENGLITHWTGGNFTQQASPTTAHLRAVWLAPQGNGDGWAGGQKGVLLRLTPLGWQGWAQTAQADVVAIAGRASDDVWLADKDGRLQHFDGATWQAAGEVWSLQTPPMPNEPKAPPKQLRAMWHSPDGTLYLVGDQGTFLRRKPVVAPNVAVFEPIAAGTGLTLHGLAGVSDSEVWLVGDRGFVGRFNGNKVVSYPTDLTQPLLAARSAGAGGPVDAVGGQGAWLRVHQNGELQNLSVQGLRVDLRGVASTFDGGRIAAGEPVVPVGPYLEFPWLQVPAQGTPITGKKGAYKVVWQASAGLDPTLNLVRLADAGYQTRWELFVRGEVTNVVLPDFEALDAGNPLPGGTNYVRLWRIYAPGTEIDSYSTKNMSSARWISWAYNVRSTDEPPWNQDTFAPTLPPQAPPPSPLPPDWPK